MSRNQLTASLVVNALVVLFTIYAVVSMCTVGTGAQVGQAGLRTFQFFTTLSNVYGALVCIVLLACEVKMLKTGGHVLPHRLIVLKQTAVTAVALTLIATIVMVAPRDGLLWYQNYFGGLFFLHFFNPLLIIVGFMFLEGGKTPSRKESLIALVPVMMYFVAYFLLVALGIWGDFYCLTFGGRAWASVLAILAIALVTYALSLLVSFLHKKRWGTPRRTGS